LDSFFVLLQHLLPRRLLSRAAGALAESRIPWLKNFLIGSFAGRFKVDMSEAENPELRSYPDFNAFFTRPLREGARPIDADGKSLVCPADGAVSQIGTIERGRVLQAKGRDFTCVELLGDEARARGYEGGQFATIYLSPRDYHRVHMPLAGDLTAETYIPGDLYSVNRATTENLERLFARNERLVCHFDTAAGPMAMVLVGAMIVAGIETVWSGRANPPTGVPKTVDYRQLPAPVSLAKGGEMGRFGLGSTVILLFPEGSIEWDRRYRADSPTRVGEVLGRLAGGD